MPRLSTITVLCDSSTPTYDASLLPFQVQYNGDANTADYFTPSKSRNVLNKCNVRQSVNECEMDGSCKTPELNTAYFRGRKLIGETFSLTDFNYKGFIIQKEPEHSISQDDLAISEIEEAEYELESSSCKHYKSNASFDHLTVYGHDSVVKSSDQWKLIPEFLKICNILNE